MSPDQVASVARRTDELVPPEYDALIAAKETISLLRAMLRDDSSAYQLGLADGAACKELK